MSKIAILGSTGSIGTQTLEVVEANPERFSVEVLTANNHVDLLFTKFGPGINANATSLTKPTSRFIEDNNYLELSTLNLSYEFGMPWMKKVGLKRLKVLFYMNDVFRASTVKQERGIDYPFARNFSVGLQARF